MTGLGAPPPADVPPPESRDLNVPIVFATSEAYFPYQYRDRDGKLMGFANEITDAVTRAMDLPMKRLVVANSDMELDLRAGRVDVLQFWGETNERHKWADFSVPIARFETVAVVRRDDPRFHGLGDLDGKRVAVGQPGTVGYQYLIAEHPQAKPVYTETSEAFLRKVSSGEIDAAVMSRLTAASMIEHFGLKNLKVLEDRIKGDKYDVRYCFTVRKGDSILLARLNEGLAVVHRTGEFDRIYQRWFGRYERRTFTPLQVVSYVAAVLALACVAISWGFIRQRTLSRRVVRQAAELAEQRSLLAAVYEKNPLATIVLEVSPANEVMLVSANSEATRLFGFEIAAPLALDPAAVGDEAYALLDDALKRWRAGGETGRWETKLRQPHRLLEATLLPLGRTDRGGQRICVLYGDVTERRLVEHELAQSRRLRALGELVGGIAHEFNNLLTPIIVTTSQARLAVITPGLRADFAVIDNAARRAAELTRRLLTFGRKADERAQPVQLVDTVENCFALLRSTVDRRVAWSIQAPDRLPSLQWNPVDANQIVFNLVINARDTLLEKLAHPPSDTWTPQLSVAIAELAPEAHSLMRRPRAGADNPPPFRAEIPPALVAWQRLTVEDNGLGIRPEIVDRLFEPFFTTKDIGQGTGLGLALVWHLMTNAGGDVTVESTVGQGTRFHVFFPRWPETSESKTGAALADDNPSGPGPLRILLAEDDPLVARAALAVLERAAHTVRHFNDGAEAWSQLAEEAATYDVLLLDLNMPRLNGIDLIRRARQRSFGGAIVIMSGRITDEQRQALQELHVERIVQKPFSAVDLLAALRGIRPVPAAAV